MTSSIAWLRDVTDRDRERVGGKACGLAGLLCAGFRVPDAFVIPVAETKRLEATDGDWPGDLRTAVVAALEMLAPGGRAVAVRSSATDEDGEEMSFAGQHATLLDVCGAEAVLAAVRQCIASLRSESAAAYRARAGGSGAGMAVVVQQMVASEIAGVAFSADPVTGDRQHIVVEAVAGFGEALVGGLREGDRFVLERDSLAVIEEHHPGVPVLQVELAREVAKAALRAEEAFGRPQDIEFAVAEGTLWMLQSRAITSGGGAATADGWVSEFDTPTSDADVWTSANVQEILPGLLTPLTMSIFAENSPQAYTAEYQRLRLLDKDEQPLFMGLFYNRAYLNLTAIGLIAARAIGGNAESLEHRYLGGERQEKSRTQHSRTIWKHRLLSALPLAKTVLTLNKMAGRIERETRRLEVRARSADPATMSDSEIEAFREELIAFGGTGAAVHLEVTGVAGTGFEAISRMVRPILKGETEGRVPTLFTGMGGVESAQIGLDLWGLARIAQREGLEDRLRANSFDPRGADLAEAWQRAFEAFLERHGHRGLAEMEASTLTWRLDPTPVVRVVRSYLDLSPDQAPPAMLARQEAQRLRLTAEVEKRMNPVKRLVFRYALRKAQGWVVLRERTKSIIVRAARLADCFVPELQRRLVERGAIERADDVFFVTGREISAFLRGGTADYRAAATRRRREYERNRHVVLPERFRGRPAPLEPDLSHHAGDVLRGTPVSPGVVTGRARVIIDPNTDGPMQPGEVLVAPVTDAGWTPLFALASALVVDMGSALSHGSTVAREYGLPAVVNVRRGTRSIRTGDLVTVNGSKGTVTILDEGVDARRAPLLLNGE